MEVRMNPGGGDSGESQYPFGDIIVEVQKGAGGKKAVSIPRERLVGRTNRDVVRMALNGIGADDPFAQGVQAILNDDTYSLERVREGSQTEWLNRDATVGEDVIKQEKLRYAFSHDHTGGRDA